MQDYKACTENDVREALEFIRGDDRETWILIGCAIKNEFGNAGFDLWDSWSASQAGYNKKQIMADWKAIKAFGRSGSVTIATLFKLAINSGYEQQPISEDERQANQIKADERARRRAIDEEKQRARDEKFRQAAKGIASKVWRTVMASGESPYLTSKQVKPYNIGFIKQGMVISYDEQLAEIELIAGKERIAEFFNIKDRPEHKSFLYLKPGVIAVPLTGSDGTIQNLQFIFQTGAKKFIKGGVKSGCMHKLGDYEEAHKQLVVVEGYSTGASIHQATGLTVYVAFDAGNLGNVARCLREKFPQSLMLFAADDDRETEAAGKGNPGRDKARAAAQLVGGFVVLPHFMNPQEGAAA